jgi:proteasome beta subunit
MRRRYDPRGTGHGIERLRGRRRRPGEPVKAGGKRGEQSRSGDQPRYETGTTIVGVRASDAVVLAADRRMSLGGRFTANKAVRKVERVHPTAAMAISGAVGPAQRLLDSVRAEAGLYASRRGEPLSVPALARTAGHAVTGLPVAPLLGGVDDDGPRVYELDGSGSVLADAYAAGGSGLQVAYGVLERRFEDGLSVEAATETATAAVATASERDTASGNGVTVAVITDDGVAVESRAEAADAGDDAEGVA